MWEKAIVQFQDKIKDQIDDEEVSDNEISESKESEISPKNLVLLGKTKSVVGKAPESPK